MRSFYIYIGAPQVLRTNPPYGHYITVRRGDSAILSMVVCADPRPRHVAWEWGSLRLEAGAGIGRYHVDDVIQDAREDCYLATLHITDADIQDARPYYLVVENERGIDRHSITLRVEGMFSGALIFFFILYIYFHTYISLYTYIIYSYILPFYEFKHIYSFILSLFLH